MPGALPAAMVSAWKRAEVPMPPSKPRNAPVPVRARPEHAEQERGEERRVDEAEHQLDDVHGIVVHWLTK